MARRSSYETYVMYYRNYTKSGRAAAKLLTKKQYEKVKEKYYGTGQNVARRIASDSMDLSYKQMNIANKIQKKIHEIQSGNGEDVKRMTAKDARNQTREEFSQSISTLREFGLTNEDIDILIDSPKEEKA